MVGVYDGRAGRGGLCFSVQVELVHDTLHENMLLARELLGVVVVDEVLRRCRRLGPTGTTTTTASGGRRSGSSTICNDKEGGREEGQGNWSVAGWAAC